MTGPLRRAGSRSEARAWAAVALLLLLAFAVVAERARWFSRLLGAAGVERTWIWSADPPRRVEPRAFFLTREFDLATPPAKARLEVLGDPEYVVYVNGRRVGANAVVGADRTDVYDVAPALHTGPNRIVLELRSPTGSGAATLRLDDEAGRTLVEADPHWRVYDAAWAGLFDGEPYIRAAKAAVIGRSAFGRWSAVRTGEPRPRQDEIAPGGPLAPSGWRRAGEVTWRPMPARSERKGELGGRVEVDFGREVTGYLYLLLDRRVPDRGLVRVGAALAESPGWNPDAIVLTTLGRGLWQDAVPRRFRYAEIVGLDRLAWAGYLPVAEEASVRFANPPVAALWGATVRPVRLPVVDDIWRRYGKPRGGRRGLPGLRPAGAARTPERARARSGRLRPGAPPAPPARGRPTP